MCLLTTVCSSAFGHYIQLAVDIPLCHFSSEMVSTKIEQNLNYISIAKVVGHTAGSPQGIAGTQKNLVKSHNKSPQNIEIIIDV